MISDILNKEVVEFSGAHKLPGLKRWQTLMTKDNSPGGAKIAYTRVLKVPVHL